MIDTNINYIDVYLKYVGIAYVCPSVNTPQLMFDVYDMNDNWITGNYVEGSVNLILATNQYTKIDFTSFTEIILTIPEGTQIKVHNMDGPCNYNLWRIS